MIYTLDITTVRWLRTTAQHHVAIFGDSRVVCLLLLLLFLEQQMYPTAGRSGKINNYGYHSQYGVQLWGIH